MGSRDLQLALLQDLLAAPGSTEGWSAFLLRLCDALGGSAASFISHDFNVTGTGIAVTARTDPEALTAYQQHWHRFDPWAHSPSTMHLTSGSVVAGEQLVPWAQMQRTAFYNDFGRRYGIVQCLAGMIEVTPRGLSCLSVNAPESRARFDESDTALMAVVLIPLQRALAIHRRLAGAELMAASNAAVLDRLPHGVLFVSDSGRVLSTNRMADQILLARDGLVCERGELRGATAQLTALLRAAIREAIFVREGMPRSRCVGLQLGRAGGRRALTVVVAPLPPAPRGPSDPAIALFVTDPDRASEPSAEEVAALFNLTPAEARLAAALAAGLDLREAADRLGLTIETVRSRLKDVFQKTGTRRQAELVLLLLTANPRLR